MKITEAQKALLRQMELLAERDHVPIIRPPAAKLLCQVVEQQQPLHILELGTAIGYSTLLLALAAPQATVVSLEIDAERQALARNFLAKAALHNELELHLGDLAQYEHSQKYDLVFIDAAKGQYPRYLRELTPHLTANAVVAADNVLFRGYVFGTEQAPRRYRTIVKRLREYLQLVERQQGYQTTIYPEGDGLAVSCRQRKEDI